MAARAGDTFEEQSLQGRLGRGRRHGRQDRADRGHGVATPPTTPASGSAGSPRSSTTGSTSKKANTPLISRAMSAGYAPASTFKVVSTAAAAAARLQPSTATYPCPRELPGRQRHQAQLRVRGLRRPSALKRALEVSCNTVFYKLGYETWLRDGGNDPKTAQPKEYFVNTARGFGYGIADRHRPARPRPPAPSSRALTSKPPTTSSRTIWCERGKTGYPEEKDPARAA